MRQGLFAVVAIVFVACGPRVGSRCMAGHECGNKLMCNGDWPQLPWITCHADTDCPQGGGNAYECGSAVMNSVKYDHVCVHPGACDLPEHMMPR